MLRIKGGNKLSGTVKISGSKNASLPILAASLLLKGKVTLKNIPKIGDVLTFLEIFSSIGVKSEFVGDNLIIDSTNIREDGVDTEKLKKIRVSILLLAPMLYHFGKMNIPFPGGCVIGKRPIDSHLSGLSRIGYNCKLDDERILIDGSLSSGYKKINAGFSVTATENLIVANVLRPGQTIIELSAIEPHVMNLIDFLRTAGANIKIRYNHTIVVEGVEELSDDFEFAVVSDYIESGTFMIMGALASEEYLDIENARIDDLYAFIEKMREAGVKIEELGNDKVRVFKTNKIKAVSLQTNIFPGFPTDLQSPFSLLMTQANGLSKIHEVMFEGRLNYLVELEKMRGQPALLNPNSALIFGPTKLVGTTVTSWDLRAGAAMVIAGLIAEGETTVTKIEYIKRGYYDFVNKLTKIGADIEEL